MCTDYAHKILIVDKYPLVLESNSFLTRIWSYETVACRSAQEPMEENLKEGLDTRGEPYGEERLVGELKGASGESLQTTSARVIKSLMSLGSQQQPQDVITLQGIVDNQREKSARRWKSSEPPWVRPLFRPGPVSNRRV